MVGFTLRDVGREDPEYYQLADKKDPELQATLRCFQDAFTQYTRQGVKIYNLSHNSLLNELKDIQIVPYTEAVMSA